MTSTSTRIVRTAVLLSLTFFASFGVSVAFAGQPSRPTGTEILLTRDFGSWKYVASKQGDGVVLSVELPDKGQKALKDYAQASSILASELFTQQDTVQATVVFKRALPIGRLPTQIVEARERISEFSLRVGGGQNDRITVFGVPGQSQIIEPEQLTLVLAQIKEKTGRADLQGITSLTLTLNLSQYQELINNPEIRFIDVIPAAAKADYERSQSADVTATQLNVIPAAVYWYHEDLNGE